MQNNSPKRERDSETRGRQAEGPQADKDVKVTGVVTDCSKLNVRVAPSADADVVAVIPALTEVVVDAGASTDTFFKVIAASGVEGFCMRKYIAIRK